jgi:Ca2+-dependent lipid-binding protein
MNSNLAALYANNKKSGRLVIDLLCADSLMPLDDDGSIDAFFTFHYMQSEVTSTVKNDTLNPIYYERLIIETDILDQQSCPPIIVNVYDKDALSN